MTRMSIGISIQSAFLLMMCICLSVNFGYAQHPELPIEEPEQSINESEETSIVERISRSSEGRITIDISESLLRELLEHPEKADNSQFTTPGRHKIKGYRVQVFGDGRNPHSLESRAHARGNAIVQKFPKYRGQVYTFSQSPNWYTTVGNFRTREEAEEALEELKSSFSSFGNEMRVRRSDIIIVNP